MIGHENVRQSEEDGVWRGKPFILTYTGKKFSYDNLTWDQIDIRDIAHSLSQLCRYTGHTNMFYSVAQHSLLVSERMPGGAEDKLCGLLHDAAETYTNDLAAPLKLWMDQESCYGSVYSRLQDSITAMIYNKYGVLNIPSDVRLYDCAAGVFEAEGFLGLDEEDLKKYSFPMELRGLWQPWDPVTFAGQNSDREMGEVEVAFLARFENLMNHLGRISDDHG